jgi:cytoskeletal protein CcmA (bactofilin family)
MTDQADNFGIPIKTRLTNTATPAEQMRDVRRPDPGLAFGLPASPNGIGALPDIAPGTPRPVAEDGTAPHALEPRKMIVGPGISLSGEINSCDRLVIEGSVQANLQKCQHLTIAEGGLFDGNAEIEEAEIRGRFEGDLVVRKRLRICATGRVSGTISYRQIEIEAGGTLSGSIQAA